MKRYSILKNWSEINEIEYRKIESTKQKVGLLVGSLKRSTKLTKLQLDLQKIEK